MKPVHDLYPRIWAWENLEEAYRKARQGKRGLAPAASFERRLEDHLVGLQDELRDGAYRPGPYHSFYIHEPKRRLISAAPFRDRVVHHALCNVIEPLFEHRFIFDSYANRVGKGTHRALDRCQHFARRYPYALQLDVVQFFPSIDHALLRQALARVIGDSQVLFPGDDLFATLRPRGLPIGNLTSQFWANVYLNGLDHFVKRELKAAAYLRYVDDLALFAADKRTLWSWRAALLDALAGLRLTIHAERAQPRPVTEGLPFLGFTIFPTHRRLKAQKAVSFQRRLKQRLAAYGAGRLSREALDATVRGWANHVRYGDTWGLRTAILGAAVVPPTRR